jgi:hypothetical protein
LSTGTATVQALGLFSLVALVALLRAAGRGFRTWRNDCWVSGLASDQPDRLQAILLHRLGLTSITFRSTLVASQPYFFEPKMVRVDAWRAFCSFALTKS